MEHSHVFRVLNEIPGRNNALYPDCNSHRYRTPDGMVTKTWREYYADLALLCAGFISAGLEKGTRVALFADNRYDWSLTDQALLSIGAPSVPRGSDTLPREQYFILSHAETGVLIMEGPANLQAIILECEASSAPLPSLVFLMDQPDQEARSALPEIWQKKVRTYQELRSAGKAVLADRPTLLADLEAKTEPEDLASIIYTSGTSGNPKGVMLSHANFLHNVRNVSPLLEIDPQGQEVAVSILPIWHVYERSFEFCMAASNMMVYYSSVRNLAEDLLRERPTIMASVPRMWEQMYGKIKNRVAKEGAPRKAIICLCLAIAQTRYKAGLSMGNKIPVLQPRRLAFLRAPLAFLVWLILSPLNALALKILTPLRALLGGRLRATFSAGGTLPLPVDIFFNAIGINLVNAYGMTESSPGSITRRIGRNHPGSIGIPLNEVEVRLVKEDGSLAARGEKGIIQVRGPNITAGYYRNPEATEAALSHDGWLRTGDIGALSISGDYVITGRDKSTIVLAGGENVEPEPIEEKLQESDLIDHVIVTGQDKKSLSAIIAINQERLQQMATNLKISWDELMASRGDSIKNPGIQGELSREIKRLLSRENGFKPVEHVHKFILLKNPFRIGEELTQKLSVRRKVVEDKYRHLLDDEAEKDKDH